MVLSPAKSLDYDSPLATEKRSEPTMLDHADDLIEILATKSPRQLSNMMGISADLAEMNFERFQNWDRPFTPETARQAILAFDGDVYQGLDVGSFNQRDFT
ncbi:MAG: peroxide stress protein YaaA, partial [Actinomycetota bacterium]